MDWPWEIAERDHELQNPTSAEKVLLLGRYLRLDAESRVLDVACGKGGPAAILAAAYGCRITGVEIRPEFAAAARERVAAAGLDRLVEIHTADATTFPLEPESLDAALCIGAAFVWGTIRDAASALRQAVRPGGFVAIGEPFWRAWPLPDGAAPDGFVSLSETADRLERAGFVLTGVIAASEDDWDRYESLHWRALEEWLAEHPDPEIRAEHERRCSDYLRYRRSLLGWAIFVGRKR
ncbi:MAG: SAM-dependent methyltransferase [Verrucomicrobiota bacterium]